MDQKKTLWIIAAVGAFLLVVFGAALIMYSPAKQQTQTVATTIPTEHKKTSGWTNNNELQPPAPLHIPDGKTAEKVPEMIVLSDNTKVYNIPSETTDSTTIDLNTLKQEVALNNEKQVTTPQAQNINITVNIPETEKVITNEYYVTKTEEVKIPVTTKTPVSEPAKKVESVKQAEPKKTTVTKVTTKTTTATKTAPKPIETKPKAVTQFWVQVAAYSNKKGAENARSVLDSNKIPADIFTFQDNKNNLFYRVRVGPYTTKSEAEYWRTRIIQISEFSKAESYVTSTTTN